MQFIVKEAKKPVEYTQEERLEHCLRVRDNASKANKDPLLAVHEFCAVLNWDFNEVLPHVAKELAE